MKKYDAQISHLVLGMAQNVRGKAYKLCPEELSHEDRLATASTYALNNLLLAACEIAVEYEIPPHALAHIMHVNYALLEDTEEKLTH
jgi:hypothetical protein